ncbi:hypothetical protein N0V83_003771 [Neocucurbitaria cava]|uniref:Xylanolytic transcriptional activator regulatory domain-containing protein n=1 Tax=Neocucurbitaria cava TaxID=798079 RepID=A0A9W8Y9V9_9PLEO|nr:hypothetical protein N0V83_003771 [Neocucurbitaria cava]
MHQRHMTRHRQKDEEAGAEGCGVLNTRKRMWKDATGKIVTKKPTLRGDVERSQSLSQPPPHLEDPLQSLPDFVPFQDQDEGAPISPPISHNASLSHSWDDRDSGIGTNYPSTTLDPNALSSSDSYSPIDQRFWSTDLSQPQPDPFASATFDDAPFNDIFNPDTASSFNNPFTTMSNYNWLFDMDLARADPLQQQPAVQDPFTAFNFNNNTVSQPSHAFDLQLDHMNIDKTLSTAGQFGSRTDSPQHHSPSAPLITPPLSEEEQNIDHNNIIQQSKPELETPQGPSRIPVAMPQHSNLIDVERPMSMLIPSRSLPIIDELARQQVLDLVDITQPTAPDGSIVMRDHPLLTLSCLQTYCDLFFTRFNTAYPLIHMSTFDPSEVDTLLLMSVLLLGATYGEKDAHQLAVCIHDVLRPQIFANAGFSAKPSLWVLQTILLVECFGKSRAGQKQHEMSHLFHGLLINLIRRSECQNIRPATLEDATDDLEDDWRTWYLRSFVSCVIDTNPLGNWQHRLATSYTTWHTDYTDFCTYYLSRLPSPDHFLAKEFQVSRTATLALYHAAHILLHTPFLDLQIYAGSRHILGRPVARNDYARSQRVVKKWVAENLKEAGKAVYHAAALVSDGVHILDGELSSHDVGGGRLWHHPWAVYLGTLVVWGVWYARPIPPPSHSHSSSTDYHQLPAHLQHLDDDEDEIIWDPAAEMKALLDTILKSSEPEKLLEVGYKGGIAGGMGKRGTNGLAAVVSRCLSKVRWAVVHDGMMVLRG